MNKQQALLHELLHYKLKRNRPQVWFDTKHLILVVHSDSVQYQLSTSYTVESGSKPMGDDTAQEVIDYLIGIYKPDTHEVLR